MTRRIKCRLAVALSCFSFWIHLSAQETAAWKRLLSKPDHEIRVLVDTKVPMRDGVWLSADVYLPEQDKKWPVLLERTPYGNIDDWYVERALYFARRGYAYVLQDVRGRYDSDGEYYAFHNESQDGRDTLDWCGTQSWSSGRVGMLGMSHMGIVQWLAARTGSPYLKAIIPQMASADRYIYGPTYTGGVSLPYVNLPWATAHSARTRQTREHYNWDRFFRHLPVLTGDIQVTGREIPFYRDWIRHYTYDDFWKKVSNYGHFHEMDLPILQISGWLDAHAKSLFANYEGLQKEGTERAIRLQKVVVGPWLHTDHPEQKAGVLDFGSESVLDLYELYLRWMDHWLKDIENAVQEEPPLKLFTMGINRWRTATKWPLPETRWTPLYLRSQGSAATLFGDGSLSRDIPGREEPPDSYLYDPRDPVPALGLHPNGQILPVDHRPVERRPDVLVYTDASLSEPLEVTGPIHAKIHASSSALDTDWTVKLLDVYPDGRAVNLCDGILRARFRNPPSIRTAVPAPGQFENPVLMEPGTVYEFFVEVGVISHVFLKGHSIRIEVSSSNFPRFDRNLNTGAEPGIDLLMVSANQTVYHDRQHPSHILLPVIPSPES